MPQLFLTLNCQNVVADRDVQTPMGQMEYTHGHEGQSVVRGGQVVFQRKLAVATAEVVSTLHLLGIPFLLIEFPTGFQLIDQIIPKCRVLNAI